MRSVPAKKLVFSLALMLGLAIAGPAYAGCLALLIGQSDYGEAKGGLPNLRSAGNDIDKMADWLQQARGCQKEDIYKLQNQDGYALRDWFGVNDTEPTRLDRLVNGRRDKEKLDVFVYYSGHGTRSKRKLENDEEAGGILIGTDALPRNIDPSSIPLQRLVARLENLQVGSTFLMVDACFTGQVRGQSGQQLAQLDDRAFSRYVPVEPKDSMVAIFATSGLEFAQTDQKLQMGLVTREFLAGVGGAADDNNDGKVSVDEIAHYISRAVPHATNALQLPSIKGPEQHIIAPKLVSVLSRSSALSQPRISPSPKPVAPPVAIASPSPQPSANPVAQVAKPVPTPDASKVEAELKLSYEDRKWAQAALKHLGYYTKALDADFGRGTRAAIRALQRAQGAAETGYLTASQWQRLKSDDHKQVTAILQDAEAQRKREAGLRATARKPEAVRRSPPVDMSDQKCKVEQKVEMGVFSFYESILSLGLVDANGDARPYGSRTPVGYSESDTCRKMQDKLIQQKAKSTCWLNDPKRAAGVDYDYKVLSAEIVGCTCSTIPRNNYEKQCISKGASIKCERSGVVKIKVCE